MKLAVKGKEESLIDLFVNYLFKSNCEISC